MIGINASGLLGNRVKSETKPINDNELESLKKTVNEIKNYLIDPNNSFSTQKKELVDIITKITKDHEETITKKIEEVNTKKLTIIEPQTSEKTVEKQVEKTKTPKTKYTKICQSMYDNLMSTEPALVGRQISEFYVGSDNSVYHKSGIRYYKIDPQYLCKLAIKK